MACRRMALAISLICCLSIGFVHGSTFNVLNRCGNSITVNVAQNPGPQISPTNFALGSGQSRTLNPPNGWGGNIGLGGTSTLLAEFTINIQSGIDHYDVSAVNGFTINQGMSISGGDVFATCSAASGVCPGGNVQGGNCVSPNRDDPNSAYAQAVRASCPTVYSWSGDNSKDYGSSTGRTYTITFCP